MSKRTYELLCTGTHLANDRKKLTGFIVIEGGKRTDRTLYYSHKGVRFCYVGQVYTAMMTVTENSSTMHGDPDYSYTWENDEEVAEYRIESESNETVISAINQSKKDAREKKDIMKCLEPLRRAHWKTNTLGQVTLEARVLHYLRHGSDF